MGEAIKVKICGQTSLKDTDISLRMGASFIGVVCEVASSKRSLEIEQAEPIFQKHGGRAFMLTCNMPLARMKAVAARLTPYALQLTGDETPEEVARVKEFFSGPVFKSVHLKPAGTGAGIGPEPILELMVKYAERGADGFVLDTAFGGKYGGTGMKSDWALAGRITASAPRPTFIAGGINPDNVQEAAALPGVYGVDLASGVEDAPGKKSVEKLEALFARLRG